MKLVDSNILMYAAGAAHRYKEPSVRFLKRVARGEEETAVDAEVLQEVLHRYRSIGRWKEGRGVYDRARSLFPLVIPITAEILDESRALLETHPDLSARDALHAAVVRIRGLQEIVSYDRDFDGIEGVKRFEPE